MYDSYGTPSYLIKQPVNGYDTRMVYGFRIANGNTWGTLPVDWVRSALHGPYSLVDRSVTAGDAMKHRTHVFVFSSLIIVKKASAGVGLWIPMKAAMAQIHLEKAWQETRQGNS